VGASKKDSKELDAGSESKREIARFPVLGAYDLCLKCSHLFNILDARGAISVTERVGVIARVRALAVGIAKAWVDQQKADQKTSGPASEESDEPSLWVRKSRRRKKRHYHRVLAADVPVLDLHSRL